MNKEYTELVSVILCVYNCEKFLTCSIESILKQTYSNFELIIINDGSTDSSQTIIDELSLTDSRIKVHRNKINIGLTKSLNIAINISKGQHILGKMPMI